MSPGRLVSFSVAGTLVVPHFLGEHDHPWLRSLLEEHDRFVGRPQRDLDARLRQPLPCESPPEKLKLAVEVLTRVQRGSSEQRYYCFGWVDGGVMTVRFTYRDDVIRIFGAGYCPRVDELLRNVRRSPQEIR